MIVKRSQRAGRMQLATHLMNLAENDHVTLDELRSFISDNLAGAFHLIATEHNLSAAVMTLPPDCGACSISLRLVQ